MGEQVQKNADASCSNKLFGAICCVCICTTIAFVAFLLVSRSAPGRRLWLPVLIQTNGYETVLNETRQLEFWTPSVKTKEYLNKKDGQVVAPEKWQEISNDDVVTQFGALLHSNKSVLGFRRVEDWGQGTTVFKPGWWWTVNVSTNYSVVNFAKVYESYWKSSHPVFIEVIDNRGSKE